MAPTDHAAALRFTYPGPDASVVLDNVTDQAGLTLDKETGVVTGYSDVKSDLSTGATRLFVYGEFDAPVTDGASSGVKGYLRFDAGSDRAVTLRLATSLIGVDQARDNLRQEIPEGTDFETVESRAQRQWDELLGRVQVEGASQDQLTTLYSSLYRLYLYPHSGFEKAGATYRYASPFSPMPGQDTPTHTGAKIVDGKVYVNNGFWDTYRTTWPAYALLTPTQAGVLTDGFVQQYKDGGWTSRWSSPGYADLMTGTSSDVGPGVRDGTAALDVGIRKERGTGFDHPGRQGAHTTHRRAEGRRRTVRRHVGNPGNGVGDARPAGDSGYRSRAVHLDLRRSHPGARGLDPSGLHRRTDVDRSGPALRGDVPLGPADPGLHDRPTGHIRALPAGVRRRNQRGKRGKRRGRRELGEPSAPGGGRVVVMIW